VNIPYGEAFPGGWQAYQPNGFTFIILRRIDPFVPFEDLVNGCVSRRNIKPGDALSAVSGLLGQMEGFLFLKASALDFQSRTYVDPYCGYSMKRTMHGEKLAD
jgi:hypothetical protein